MVRRVVEIDGIRGCAILLVIAHHYVADQILFPAVGGSAEAVRTALRLSWSGVDLFFVLSGFLIARGLLRNRDAANYFRVFYARRACRILPAYLILLAGYYGAIATGLAARPGLTWLFGEPLPDLGYLTFTQNIVMGLRETCGAPWLTPTWSLAVEEQFYLVVPAVVLLARSRLALVAGAVFLAAPLLRFAYPGFHTYVAAPFRADSLAAGVLLALALESPAVRAWLTGRRGLLRSAVVLMAAATVALTFFPVLGALEYAWLATLYAAFTALVLTGPGGRLARALRWRPLTWIGVRSYSLYLFHLPLLGLVHGARRTDTPELDGPSDILATLLALVASLGVAALAYRLIEQPFIELGQRARYASSPAPASARETALAGAQR